MRSAKAMRVSLSWTSIMMEAMILIFTIFHVVSIYFVNFRNFVTFILNVKTLSLKEKLYCTARPSSVAIDFSR